MLIDIGANLTHDSFDADRDAVLERAHEVGVELLVVTGADIQGSEDAAALADQYDVLYATAGIHPHHAEETTDAVIDRFRELTQSEKVKAVGETGLDFFRDFSPRPTQISSFEKHIELAIDIQMPMFLHERDSFPTFAEVLKPHRDQLSRVVVHCFTGEKDALFSYLDMDCYIGITGWICDERRGKHLLELIKNIPQDRLMIESDAPYLMPRTIKPKPDTRRNEPMYLPAVAETVSECLGLSYDELAQMTTENARTFFNLPAARSSG